MKFEWEVIHEENSKSGTSRARVPGGWLVATIIIIKGAPSLSVCFVHDPEWYWDLT